MKGTRAIFSALMVFLCCVPPISSVAQVACVAAVAPGDYTIDLGKYSNWNSVMNRAHCNTVRVDCSINASHTQVGDTTTIAGSLSELTELVTGADGFAFDCLDKGAVLVNKGQQAFVGVYDSDLGFQGVLWQHFQGEANKCYDHFVELVANANMCN